MTDLLRLGGLSVDTWRHEDRAVAHVRGEIDLCTGCVLRDGVQSLLGTGCGWLILDLEEVTFFGSEAVRELLNLQQRAAVTGMRMVLAAVPPKALRILEITGTLDAFVVHPTVAKAWRGNDGGAPRPARTRAERLACGR